MRSIRAFRSSASLGLVAYLLLLRGSERIDPPETEGLLKVLDGAGVPASWAGFMIASQDVGADRFGWLQWETSLRDERVGVITFERYIDLAFARERLEGRVSEPLNSTAQGASDLRYTLERLTQAVDELLSTEQWDWLATTELRSRREPVLSELNAAIENDIRDDEDQLISLPLESKRIQKFVDAVQNQWTDRGGLRRLFTGAAVRTVGDP